MAVHYELATAAEVNFIRASYSEARAFQRAQGAIEWPEFTEASIRAEIAERRLWRVLNDGECVGLFTVAYADPAIWRERENGAHIYLHRISRAASSTSSGLFAKVLAWAVEHCRGRGAAGIRMDTWATNDAIIAYYQRFGFALVARVRLGADPRLPDHYHGNEFALLERDCAELRAHD